MNIKVIYKIFRVMVILVYLSSLCYIVFFARRRQGMHSLERYKLVNKMPVANKVKEYNYLSYHHNTREERNFFVNIFGNIVLFIPLPLTFVWLIGLRTPGKLALLSICASISIEVVQFLLKSGVADIDDIILNTSGALLGILIVRFMPAACLSSVFDRKVHYA
jgi:glycopeptide antibiotics resistance protein